MYKDFFWALYVTYKRNCVYVAVFVDFFACNALSLSSSALARSCARSKARARASPSSSAPYILSFPFPFLSAMRDGGECGGRNLWQKGKECEIF